MSSEFKCFSCDFAKRDEYNRYVDRCSGYSNCSYMKFTGKIYPTIDEFIEKLENQYSMAKPNSLCFTSFHEGYTNGIKDCLNKIKRFLKEEEKFRINNF